MHARCGAGDGAACDALFVAAPAGSQYEEFASTCGGTSDGERWCDQGRGTTPASAEAYGDDPVLDALWDRCAGGEGKACDELFTESPIGSQYEEFGNTCAGRSDGSTWCAP